MENITLEINENVAMDIEQLTNGGFNPLTSFMNYSELESVLEKMRLPSGEVWSIPILFPKPHKDIRTDETIILKFSGIEFAKFKVDEVFSYDSKKMIKQFFETDDDEHPGVKKMKDATNQFMSGKITKSKKLAEILNVESLEPHRIKEKIKALGWKKIAGFHTRNPPHRAHEYLHKTVLKSADGILIHPLIGSKKLGDFTNTAILNCYRLYSKTTLPPNKSIITPLLTYSRYAGPREALFTAIIRRNYGCTHFIVGRDHTGVKNFYGKYESQEIFKSFTDIGIEPIFFSEPYFCKICNKVTTEKECRCGKDGFVEISGTIIRKAIVDKTKLSEIYMQKEILEELQKLDNPFVN